jgi:hypothetical protein
MWHMNYRNVQPHAWLPCSQWVPDVMNHTTEASFNWRTLLEALTGQTTDISILLCFLFRDVACITQCTIKQISTEKSNEIRGRFAGFSWNVGHAMTFKGLTDAGQIMRCSQLRLAAVGENILKLDAEAGVVPA